MLMGGGVLATQNLKVMPTKTISINTFSFTFILLMKKNIFSGMNNKYDKPIFKDETIFYPDYLPEKILSRDAQLKELTYLLKPLLNLKKANNLLIYGPPGTGKTLTSVFVLKELCEYTTKVKYIYFNVIKDNTRYSVLSGLVSFFGDALPRRGLAIDEILSRLNEFFSKSYFSPVIILDEIDKMDVIDSSNLLYDLTRFSSNNKFFTVILITNHKSFILDLDKRTQSSLFLSEIEYPKYKPTEIKDILKERIDYGLVPGSINEDLIGYISGFAAARGGDARIAIDLIYKAGKEAEKQGLQEITRDVLLSSAKFVDSQKLSEKIKYLSKEEIDVLLAIDDGIVTTELYCKLNLSERAIRRYLDTLEKLELIKIDSYRTGKAQKRRVSLRMDPELLRRM